MKKIKCPYHKEKVPSLVISNDKFHCYGCGKSGSLIELNIKLKEIKCNLKT